MLIGVESSLTVTVQASNYVDTGFNTFNLNRKIESLVSGLKFVGFQNWSAAAKKIRELVDQIVWADFQGEQSGPN